MTTEPSIDALFLDQAAVDGARLLVAADTGWERPVPDCPGWTVRDLVRHTAGIFEWMSAIATSGERVDRRTLPPVPTEAPDLSAWYLVALQRTLDVFRAGRPDAAVWTFSTVGDRELRWWYRRLAVEVAIHRWDSEQSAAVLGGPLPGAVDAAVSSAGIDEFLLEFLPGLLGKVGNPQLTGTLQLRASDAGTRWWIDLAAGGSVRTEPQDAATTISGSRSALLLWLTNRARRDELVVTGDARLLDAWTELRR